MNFEVAERIADAVLYEGYVLYPYRASAAKNRLRWQFGVVAPRAFSEATGSDPWWAQTECLLDPQGSPTVNIRLRFLQVQARAVEQTADDGCFEPVATLRVGDRDIVGWDEGTVRTHDISGVAVRELVGHECVTPIHTVGDREIEIVRDGWVVKGRIARERRSIDGCIRVSAEHAGRFLKLRVSVENNTEWNAEDGDRERAMRRSLLSTHVLIHLRDGAFQSLLDPAPDAAEAVASCANVRTWPVLVGGPGQRDLLLSSPIILYDYPAIAPESPQDLCDGTEIDELLTLRVMTLTDDEKQQARATDDRAREIVDRIDSMARDGFERLHGAIRQVRPLDPAAGPDEWETLLNPSDMPSPQHDTVDIAGVCIAKGSRVIVRPNRRADPIDMFMRDRVARVEGIYRDLEGATHVAVVLDDDPSGDLHAWYGRYLYYAPEELEPFTSAPTTEPPREESANG